MCTLNYIKNVNAPRPELHMMNKLLPFFALSALWVLEKQELMGIEKVDVCTDLAKRLSRSSQGPRGFQD